MAATLFLTLPATSAAQSWWDEFFGGSGGSGTRTRVFDFGQYYCGGYGYDTCGPTSYQFIVPDYSTLTVEVWGGGGMGSGSAGYGKDDAACGASAGGTFLICGKMVREYGCDPQCANGSGGQSSFNGTVVAHGGKRGYSTAPGQGGTASGGDDNIIGNSGRPGTRQGGNGDGGDAPNGGRGQCSGSSWSGYGSSPNPGAGGCGGLMYSSTQALPGQYFPGGGSGGYAKKTYAPGELAPGTTVPVVVGFPGKILYWGATRGNVGAGRVKVTWTDAAMSPAPTCSVTFDENPISEGEGTQIYWSSSNAEWMYINSVGYVESSGSAFVQPSETTNYDGSAGAGDQEIECPATLTVTPSEEEEEQCVATFSCSGNGVLNSCTGEVEQCPGGQVCSNGACVCPAGQIFQGGQCVQAGPQCAPYYCIGNDLYQNDAQCVGSLVQTCNYACSGGACIPPPEANGDITATPSLVRTGDTTRIEWTTIGMVADSCAVTENDPAIEDVGTGSAGAFTSSPLAQRTTYTLACETEVGGIFTDTATVNIVPVFQEE